MVAPQISIYFRAMHVVLLLRSGEGVSVLDILLFMNLSWSILHTQTQALLFSFCSLITWFSLLPKYLISLKLLVILSWHMQTYWGKYTECLDLLVNWKTDGKFIFWKVWIVSLMCKKDDLNCLVYASPLNQFLSSWHFKNLC